MFFFFLFFSFTRNFLETRQDWKKEDNQIDIWPTKKGRRGKFI